MAQTYEFYSERANAAAEAAENASLENVRQREMRAEKTWRGLAAHALKASDDREERENERLAKLEAQMQAEQ
jgi:hypothetical protein